MSAARWSAVGLSTGPPVAVSSRPTGHFVARAQPRS